MKNVMLKFNFNLKFFFHSICSVKVALYILKRGFCAGLPKEFIERFAGFSAGFYSKKGSLAKSESFLKKIKFEISKLLFEGVKICL